ncbi:cytochrome c biogenesis protein CcmA [Cupriavidus sp. HMR-1]|uniref:cytochrome c biogenesis heme-transporting ATPase CcmA n=1 Tax=Cupriavidus sp. HMR-1 TaxID=1249621 RepID=UPI0002A44904|nr:cytochrome c biogenesis heme-transporting ATPase CcmA [Cupriavidus sp. HMR-1]EKZ99623.1 cytochrome c biogenesis protein CcmA [Cupriavidus sp. HMR-1]
MADAVLEARELGVRRGHCAIFRGLGISLAPGDLLQVMGPNGAGKTSLLRVLSSLMPPAEGDLYWRGRPVRAGDPDYLAQVAYLGHVNGIYPDLSAFENLQFAARMAGQQPDAEAMHHALARFGLDRVADAPARTLSQGQRRRVALARLALAPRALWLLDEPLTSLDDASTERFHTLLAEHLHRGGIAVIATHQRLPAEGAVLDLARDAGSP